jgi:pimeloyl-ACP methyl ester carboxylesterase
VTIVGHSLGGGIAMSFAYYYPARVDRMALISSGGFGREVHPLLRALSLPGAGPALRLLTMGPTLALLARFARLLRTSGAVRSARGARRIQLLLTRVGCRGQRAAMIKTLRSVIGWRGQSVSALDRMYALRRFPTLVVWGTRDRMIPAHHATAALASNPGAGLALIDGTGHLPHVTRAALVAERLSSFINDSPAGAPVMTDNRVTGSTTAPRPAGPPVFAAEASF